MLAGIVVQPLGVKQEVCFAPGRQGLPLLGFRYVGVVVRKGTLLLPGQYHGQDNDGYADPQLECVLET